MQGASPPNLASDSSATDIRPVRLRGRLSRYRPSEVVVRPRIIRLQAECFFERGDSGILLYFLLKRSQSLFQLLPFFCHLPPLSLTPFFSSSTLASCSWSHQFGFDAATEGAGYGGGPMRVPPTGPHLFRPENVVPSGESVTVSTSPHMFLHLKVNVRWSRSVHSHVPGNPWTEALFVPSA